MTTHKVKIERADAEIEDFDSQELMNELDVDSQTLASASVKGFEVIPSDPNASTVEEFQETTVFGAKSKATKVSILNNIPASFTIKSNDNPNVVDELITYQFVIYSPVDIEVKKIIYADGAYHQDYNIDGEYFDLKAGINYVNFQILVPVAHTYIRLLVRLVDAVAATTFYVRDIRVYAGDIRSAIVNEVCDTQQWIISKGDSITKGLTGTYTNTVVYSDVLNEYFDQQVLNWGIGGENVQAIGARVGALPAIFDVEVTIPATTTAVSIPAASVISSYDRSILSSFLRQSGKVGGTTGLYTGMNPCSINNIEGDFTYNSTSGAYEFVRRVAGDAQLVKKYTPLVTHNARHIRNKSNINIYFQGTNGWTTAKTPADLTDMLKKQIEFDKSDKFIVIGIYEGGTESFLEELEAEMVKEFGVRYFNLRMYLITNALDDAGITPTQDDLDAIALGECPPSLRFPSDIHLNDSGQTVLGEQLIKMVRDLNYTL